MTHRSSLALIAAALAAGVVVGCDTAAQDQATAARQLEEAIEIIDRAHVGFVPDAEGDAARDVPAYRQATLEGAVGPLEKAIANGSPTQATAAAGLRADIAASQAMHRTDRALAAARELLTESNTLLSRVVAYDASLARVAVLDRDLTPVASTFRETAEEQRSRSGALDRSAGEVRSELGRLRSQAGEARSRSSAALRDAERFDERAFVASGEERYTLQDRAADARRDAARARADAETLGVRIASLEVRLGLLDRQVAALDAAAAALTDQADAARRRQGELDNRESAATADRDAAEAALVEDLGALMIGFRDRVSEPLDEAAQSLRDAIETLSSVRDSPGLDAGLRTELELSVLSRRLDLAHVLTHHAGAVAAFGHAVAAAEAASPRLASASGQVQQALADLRAAHATLVEQTIEVVLEGRELAAELADGGRLSSAFRDASAVESMQLMLARLGDALSTYVERVQATEL